MPTTVNTPAVTRVGYTLAETAAALGQSTRKVRGAISQGRIPAVDLGRREVIIPARFFTESGLDLPSVAGGDEA